MSMFSCQPISAVTSTEPMTAFNVTQVKQQMFLISDPCVQLSQYQKLCCESHNLFKVISRVRY